MQQFIASLLGTPPPPKRKTGRYYVYELLDPRFDPPLVFYVGKGSGDRKYQHEKDVHRLLKTRKGIMNMRCLHHRIAEIWRYGYKEILVREVPDSRTDDENEAYCFEAHRIEHYGLEHLCNETYGSLARCKKIGQK